MDVTPSTKFSTKPRSSRSRHGSLKGGPARRPPSPDSACEHDGEWVSGAISGPEDVTSDMSEEGSEKTRRGAGRKIESATQRRQSSETTAVLKGAACQDSDVDSGIVAYRKPGQRIGSTSSADTDSSQESRRRIEYSPPIQKNELPKSRSCNGSLRVAKRTSCPNQQGGPIKADHSALKECNRRPPTPLTVFPDSHHCVRFDEQLQLSEQNLRRSCRKLFATLYAQRFSYPIQQSGSIQARNSTPGSTRIRSRTAPELDLRRYSPVSVGGQSRHIQSYKENLGPVDNHRAGGLAWAVCSVPKATTDVSLSGQVRMNVLSSPPPSQVHRYNFHMYNRVPMDLDDKVASRTPSTDSGLGSSSQCTCHSRQTHISLSSSQSNTSQCTCRCCNCVQQVPRVLDGTSGLFKSSSCSTLSSVLSHQSRPQLTQFPPRTMRRPLSPGEPDSKLNLLQKTPSCSNLLDKVSGNYQIANVPVYSDSMVHAYAQIASVIPDGVKSCSGSQGGRRAQTLGRIKYTNENIYDSLRPLDTMSTLSSSKSEPPLSVAARTDYHSLNSNTMKDLDNQRTAHETSSGELMRDSDTKSTHSAEIYSQITDNTRQSLRQNRLNASQRPKSVGVVSPSCGQSTVYLKSALKKPTQSAMQHVNEMKSSESEVALNGNLNRHTEVEYAVVDKSKKNRFTSLPVLNGYNGTPGVSTDTEDKDHPPVPPKKLLHKSDFSLYRSRSSSPRKTLLERMQTLTKNAKSALQKAFSTERIYRPEREERMEATGQKSLQRSRSFIKGLTGSFRKKKRKSRPTVPEVVPQASSNPEWDEQPLGPNSPVHVRGQLLQLNLDGSQVVELTKPPSKPYGFFVARGRVRNSKGVFVSRMRDQETQKQLAGLLDIGDEILEIDGCNVKNADIMEVNSLMANKNTLLLTVLPYICRKDI